MNYNKIHDAIIDRARERVSDSSLYHNHHIIPLHEDKNSTKTVPLTIKEHYVAHHLRWKMVGTPGNLYAYRWIKNGEQDPEAWIEFCRENGRKGGTAWLEQSTPEQRSELGRKGGAAWLEQSTPEQRSEWGRKGAAAWLEQSTPEQRSEIASKRMIARGPERLSEWGRKGRAAWLDWLEQSTPEQRSEIVRKGHATRKANKQLREASLDI
jgi:hypothetical protein